MRGGDSEGVQRKEAGRREKVTFMDNINTISEGKEKLLFQVLTL